MLILIPKNKNSTTINQWWPISLWKISYKVLSKILTTRLKLIMPAILEPFQGDFTQDWCATDNAIMVLEVLHSIITNDRRLANGAPCSAIKLDLSREYDQINWEFLAQALQAFQFPSSIIQLIMWCLRSTSISIRFNNISTLYFTLSRSLWQGNSLSHLFFNICISMLLSTIQAEVFNRMWKAAFFNTSGIHISHMSFIDDTVLCGKASMHNV